MKVIINDGGRSDAGYKGTTGDCAVRAIAIAAEVPYQEVYDKVKHYGSLERTGKRKKGKSHPRTGVFKRTLHKIMEDYGFKWTATMGIGTGCKVHVREGELPSGRLVLSLSRHVTAVIDGVIHDLYDPSRQGTRCVYGYWTK